MLEPAYALNASEREIMRTHPQKGRQIIDTMLLDFGRESFEYLNILRNIAEYHHETLDGGGYPHGLRGDEILMESRIVAVADVFDALTSHRCSVDHAGTFTMSETSEQWKPFTSPQRVVTYRPAFVWDDRIAMIPGGSSLEAGDHGAP